ncbi:MAG TPA: beta-propeller fold lactonase family protein [Gammaproteobacteria bacterium]|nr:beta-propeller fold lactonase family protein [Gammaproteobacteria bacterium]
MNKSFVEKLILVLTLGVTASVAAAPSVYIPLGNANQVQVIDAARNSVTGVVEGVENAHGLAVTPDGRFLVVGSYSELPPGAEESPPRPEGMSEAEHERHHARPNRSAPAEVGTSYVSVADTDTRKVFRRIDVRGAVHHVAVSPDGRFAVTTHPGAGGISVIAMDAFAVIRTVPTGPAPNYAVFAGDGRSLFVTNSGDNTVSEVAVGTWKVLRNFPSGGSPEHLVLSEDSRTLYVNNVADGTVSVISVETGRVTGTIEIGTAPHGVDISDDGRTLFVSSQGDDKLAAIDLASGKSRTLALGPAPYHVTTVRGSGKLYVSSRAENRIWVVDQNTLSVVGEVVIGGIGHQMVVAAR